MSDNEDDIEKIVDFPISGKLTHTPEQKDWLKTTVEKANEYLIESEELIGGKIILVGHSAAGKTCLFNRSINNKYEDNYKVTIGFDFLTKKYNILGIDYEIEVWDTSGEEKFLSLTEQYFRDANIALVCFDITDEESFKNVSYWHKQVLEKGNENCKFFLVACKSDKYHVIQENEALEKAKELKAEYWATSAKNNVNVHNLFKRITSLAFDTTLSEKLSENNDEGEAFNVTSDVKKKKKDKCC